MGEEGEQLEKESESDACGMGGSVVETPVRNQITAPVSQFEDSPVFNYINSLSPIKTVKSRSISQAFNSFSFASLPSIFTSPHVSSLKESRFLRRHHFSEPSKPDFSSENWDKVGGNEGIMDFVRNSDEQQENFHPGSCMGEASVEPTYQCSKLAIEVSRTLSYDCGSPDRNTMSYRGIETKYVSELAGTSTSVVPFVQEVSEIGFLGSGVHLERVRNIKQNKEGSGCDWESLISDDADLLTFGSPNATEARKGPFQKPLDPGTSLCTSLISEFMHDEFNDLQNTQAVGPTGVEQWESENPPSQVGQGHLKEIEATGDILASTSLNKHESGEPSEQIDNEPVSNLHRGMRRRCLVFEIAATRRKHLDDGSTSGSSMLSQSDVNIEFNEKQLAITPGDDSSRCILPGIGLHLNALARTSKDYNITLGSGRQSIDPSSSSLTTGQECLNNSLALTSMEGNMDPAENGVQGIEDASQGSGYIASEECNQSSPKKKRRRLENAVESEGCKRCTCKKSKCLKLMNPARLQLQRGIKEDAIARNLVA